MHTDRCPIALIGLMLLAACASPHAPGAATASPLTKATDQAANTVTRVASSQSSSIVSPTPLLTRSPAPAITATPPATASASPTMTTPLGSVAASQPVNMRAGPGTEYDVVGQLKVAQSYPVVGQVGEWWEVVQDNAPPAWVVKLLVAFTGDAQAVPVNIAPATPTIPPSVTELAQDGIVTFTSTVFGITFSYKPSQFGPTVRTLVSGDKVYVFTSDQAATDEQSVQVLHKAPADSLRQAIQKQFLAGVNPKDCPIVENWRPTGAAMPPGYVFAAIMLPPSLVFDVATAQVEAQKCPPTYTQYGGSAYFMEDTRHPDRYFFFKIGQYSIFSAGPSEYGDPWQDTLRVIDASQ